MASATPEEQAPEDARPQPNDPAAGPDGGAAAGAVGDPAAPAARSVGRRALFAGLGAAAAGVVGLGAGFGAGRAFPASSRSGSAESSGTEAHGQGDTVPSGAPRGAVPEGHAVPGVTEPAVPQRHTRVAVLALGTGLGGDASRTGRSGAGARDDDEAVRTALRDALRAVRGDGAGLGDGAGGGLGDADLDDAGTVTVAIGVSPPLAAKFWPDRVAHAEPLPPFANDAGGARLGGDVLVQVSAETAHAAAERERAVLNVLVDALPGTETVWQAAGYRDAPTAAGTTRTGIGFIDGIINPREAELLDAGVWTGEGRRDTYLVARRMRIDSDFSRLPRAEQERAVGRERATGRPLSGGDPMDQVDLFAKAPDGHLLTPSASHVRRAHPSNIGRPLMLRRSYTLSGDGDGDGLLFLAFMNDPTTFVMTQRRLDEQDDLIARTSTDAGGVFFVPEPGTL